MDIVLEIDNGEVELALNGGEIQIQGNFDEDDPDSGLSVSVTNYKLGRDSAKIINAYIANGLTGGTGIWEGLPFKLKLVSATDELILTDGFLDLASASTEFMCDIINAPVKGRGSNAWLRDNEEFPFELLASDDYTGTGKITSDDYISIPYVLLRDTSGTDIILLLISGYVIASQIANIVNEIINIATEIGTSFLAVVVSILKLIILILFLVILIAAMIKLLEELYEKVIGRVKYHNGMKLKTLLEKGAAHLGQTFRSTVFDDPFWADVIVLPEKFNAPEEGGLFGFLKPDPTQSGFYQGTFGDLMREVKKLWNARKIVGGGVIRIEPRSVNVTEADYTIDSVEILKHGTNADDLKANYGFRFSTDLQDTNTIRELEGTTSEVITQPNTITNQDMVLMKGREAIVSNFALGKKKVGLTEAENVFIALLQIVSIGLQSISLGLDGGALSAVADDTISDIKDRESMLKISSNQLQKPKLIGIKITSEARGNRIKDEDKITSDQILDDFHASNFFTPSVEFPNANQWKRYETPKVIFCLADWRKIENNNLIFDNEGREAKIESLDWNPQSELATINYRRNELYSRNLNQTIFTPDGT